MSSEPIPAHGGLARRRLGVVHIVFFTVAASAPLTVLGGGVTTTYAVTGNSAVPLSFLLLAVALALFAVGYAAMSRYVANAGAFYSYLANGLGRATGVSGSFVALTGYNCIQIGLYGLFGAVFGDFAARKFGIEADWWLWALVAWLAIAILGLLRVDLNATVLAVLLILEVIVVATFDFIGFTNPAGGAIEVSSFDPGNLFVGGVGAVFALGVAAFTGFESAAIYSEESKDPRRTVARATYIAVAFTGLFYALSAWALIELTGVADVQAASGENGAGVIFGALAEHFGEGAADIANLLFITSMFAALLSFHNGVARYFFALGRERVLPQFLGRAGVGSGAPVAGSLLQSGIALVVVLCFVAAAADPVLELFTWLSGISAVAVVLLMAGTSAAVVGFFRRRPREENLWQRAVAPTLATIALLAILITVVANFEALLTPDTPAWLRWALPGVVLLAAVIGLIWAAVLRSSRPEAYAGIGRGAGEPMSAAREEFARIG